MKSPEDYDRLYSQKCLLPTSCSGCLTKLTKIKKTETKNLAFVCWNLGECRLALDLAKVSSWELVPQE